MVIQACSLAFSPVEFCLTFWDLRQDTCDGMARQEQVSPEIKLRKCAFARVCVLVYELSCITVTCKWVTAALVASHSIDRLRDEIISKFDR